MGEMVVLLHGLGRTPRSMRRLERALHSAGHSVANLRYPATRKPIEELADDLHALLRDRGAPRADRVHFVTHSMGGILLRFYLERRPMPNIGRVVMLAPPNGGSELVDLMLKIPLLRLRPGPSRRQLGTGPVGIPARLGPVRFELGIIAGDRSNNPLYSLVLPGRSDGKVTVERAKAPGMKDFLVLPYSHSWIMWHKQVIHQSLHFLKRGMFERRGQVCHLHI
jgi:pimeloyl-ACP methyl ester carboxylesterase